MKTVLFLLFLVSAGLQASPAGRPGGPPGREFLKRADQDGDSVVTLAEFRVLPRIAALAAEKQEALFARLDKDKNGSIDRSELPAGRARRPGPGSLRKLDRDGDGQVDWAEFQVGPLGQRLPEERRRAFFDRLDRNGDGVLSAQDRPARRGGRPGPGGGFDRFDTNGDGVLDLDEFEAAAPFRKRPAEQARKRFAAIDQNEDGRVSRRELEQRGGPRFRRGGADGPQPRDSRGEKKKAGQRGGRPAE